MEYEIKPQRHFDFGLKELWKYKELFYFFTWRDVKIKYKQTILGFLWAVLQPLISMLILTYIFGRMLQAPSSELKYPVFVLSGLIFWNIFSNGVSNAGSSMINNSNIIKKIYFPRLIIPLSSVLVSVFDFLMTLIVFFGVLIYYSIEGSINVNWLLLVVLIPCSVVTTCIATFGLGTFLAALNIKYRDFRYIIPFIIQILFYASPVLYSLKIESVLGKIIFSLNPMYASIEMFRSVLTGIFPDMLMFLVSLFSSLILFFLGIYYFRKTEYYFADLA